MRRFQTYISISCTAFCTVSRTGTASRCLGAYIIAAGCSAALTRRTAAPFLPPGPSCETELEELPEELLPPGVEEPPEEELPPVPVESVVPERKEPETIPVRPSFVCVLPSYSWERNWNT